MTVGWAMPRPDSENRYPKKSKPRLMRPMNVFRGCCFTFSYSSSGFTMAMAFRSFQRDGDRMTQSSIKRA